MILVLHMPIIQHLVAFVCYKNGQKVTKFRLDRAMGNLQLKEWAGENVLWQDFHKVWNTIGTYKFLFI